MSKKGIGSKCLVICFLTIIFSFSLANFHLLVDPLKALRSEEGTFEKFTEEVKTAYQKDFYKKHSFVSLNGLYARMIGFRVHNQVVRTNNGMLTYPDFSAKDVLPLSSNVSKLNECLSSMDIPFLYVQAPYKLDLAEEMLPTGVENTANQKADQLVAAMQEQGVEVLDLRPFLSATPEDLEKYFYLTDHHWNSTGAFIGFQKIAERLQTIFPEQKICGLATERDQWENHVLKDYFLGSHGKRVGPYFGGVDDLIYFTPKFETYMSCAIPGRNLFYKGNFSDANIRSQYTKGEPDYYGSNPYCVYIGGDYPLVQHRNANAPVKLRVLMVKDSFMLPVQAYFSTVFQEIDVVDLRHFKECSLIEYINGIKPDVVIYMATAGAVANSSMWEFGIDEFVAQKSAYEEAELIFQQDELVVEADSASKFSYMYLYKGLEKGCTYTLHIDSAQVYQGGTGGIGIRVYDFKQKKTISSYSFDLEYCQENGGYTCVIHTPENDVETLDLIIYAGIPGNTNGVGIMYEGISLHKGLLED